MTPDLQTSIKSFKQRKSLATRKEEVAGIRAKFPTKIPVVVERYVKETRLGCLDKMKFLVPQELTMSQFVTIIRNRLHLHASQAFYLMVGNKSLTSLSKTMGEIYRDNKDDDGFLYITYASQEMFGGDLDHILTPRFPHLINTSERCHRCGSEQSEYTIGSTDISLLNPSILESGNEMTFTNPKLTDGQSIRSVLYS